MTNTSVTTLLNKQDCSDAVHEVIQSAQQSIAIFSQQLEPLLYNHREICDAMSSLARKNQHSHIRVLVVKTQSISLDGHCLITLAQRIPSSIQIKVPVTAELLRFSESWLIADNHTICQINNPDRYEGSLIKNDRLHVKTKMEFFDHAWENSQPDQNTRRLSI
ncbi:MAG: hypothetical protein HOM14_17920 [Gammaproteobacteria bacterium]|jgi:hypothetical protein|nr:hypothetical protein [Gammaproteobacteria bacterium]MBT3723419.1 hypothetical protein [Gammaproteobacteria bacterium]MBT4077660.1 hypothetical protein [Gammaproteobacteria bacterium]MBT4196335.1 hypothetical protein [Gammaproteobacteria bacterium]MBT4452403.1 hypothetical protein [Gammaproteobacteria bacterium]